MAESLALADRAHEVLRQIVALGQQVNVRLIAMGQLLAEARDDKLYRVYDCETFEAFLGMPEVGLSRTHAYRLIEIAATFAPGVPPVGHAERLAAIGVKKLSAIVPLVRVDPAMASEWLDKAEALSASALDEEIAESRGVVRTELDEWYERRFRHIQAVAQQGISGAIPPGAAFDAICAEAMRGQERAKEAEHG